MPCDSDDPWLFQEDLHANGAQLWCYLSVFPKDEIALIVYGIFSSFDWGFNSNRVLTWARSWTNHKFFFFRGIHRTPEIIVSENIVNVILWVIMTEFTAEPSSQTRDWKHQSAQLPISWNVQMEAPNLVASPRIRTRTYLPVCLWIKSTSKPNRALSANCKFHSLSSTKQNCHSY